ncbi:MAG: CAP family protein [Deltaproteobacteria bacterium]|nr:CAP family protein [Deltaproteobacteria bacterium]
MRRLAAVVAVAVCACSAPAPEPREPEIGQGPGEYQGDGEQAPVDVTDGRQEDPPAPDSGGDTQPPPAPAGSKLEPRYQLLVDSHNAARAQHCAAPLRWSPTIAAYAQQWANKLRDSGCRFDHRQPNQYGENLAAYGPPGSSDGRSVTTMWVKERQLYDWNNPGFSMKTGHFTQVVWGTTREVGCGTAICNGMELWVCNYAPAGNVRGEYPRMVKPQGCR